MYCHSNAESHFYFNCGFQRKKGFPWKILENPINMDWFHGKSHLEMDDLENPINMDWFHGKSHLKWMIWKIPSTWIGFMENPI